MRLPIRTVPLVVFAFASVACGSGNTGPTGYTCSSLPYSCTEYAMLTDTSDPTLQTAKTSCVQGGGTWASGTCPLASRIGGCQFVPNQIIWYYPASSFQTTAQLMTTCMSDGGTFFPP
jgi:hypothetical protein